jgi:exopolysaccharide production protein ExoQ
MEAQIEVTKFATDERAESHGLASAVGFFFSFRLCIVLLSVDLLGVEPSTGTAIGILLGVFLFGLVCVNAEGPAASTLRSVFQASPARWAIAFIIFSGLSLVWSETASLPNSAAYWAGMAIDVASVVLLIGSETSSGEGHAILKGYIWSTCCLAAIAWIMPAASDLRLGDEQFFNSNEIGNLCAFAIFFAQYLTRAERGDWRTAKFFLVVTLIRSLSKATLAAFLLSEVLLLILDKSMSRKTKWLIVVAALILLAVFWGLLAAYFDYYTNNGNQAETLTGRIVIWLYVLGGITDHSWTLVIGHGFDSWWKVVPPFGGELFEARHAENEILQQLYAYGLAGIVLLIGIYGGLFRQLRKLEVSPVRTVFLCFLAYIVVRGLAESDAFDLLLPLWAIILISSLATLRLKAELPPVSSSPNELPKMSFDCHFSDSSGEISAE